MSDIDYIKIFKNAWNIAWRNKFLWWFGLWWFRPWWFELWWFGLLVSLAGAGGGLFNFPADNSEWEKAGNEQVANFVSNHMTGIIIGAVIIFIFLIIFLILGVIGRGALIKEIHRIIKNKPANFKMGMRDGKRYFWKLFFQNMLMGLSIIISILVLTVPVIILFASKAYVVGTLVAILAILIFIPLAVLIAFLRLYGKMYLVLGDLKIISSLEQAYELLMKNKLASVIMVLLFIPISLAFMAVFLIFLVVLFILFIPLGLILNLALAGFAIALGIICFLASLLFIKSVYETFSQAVWVLFFHEIAVLKVEETITEAEPEKEKTLPITSPVKTIK